MAKTHRSARAIRPAVDNMENQLQKVEAIAWRFYALLALSGLLYAMAAVWPPLGLRGFFFFVAFCLALLAATSVFGGVFGFLFGIPRILQAARAPEVTGMNRVAAAGPASRADVARRLLASNSNLEEISVWLTKIIVGLGLINLGGIPDKIAEYGNRLAAHVSVLDGGGPQAALVALEPYLVALSLSGFAAGFLFFYLETRTRVALLLLTAEVHNERVANGGTASQEQLFNVEGGERGDRGAEFTLAKPRPDDARLLTLPLSSLEDVDEIAEWAAAKARNREFQVAELGWLKAIGETRSEPSSLYLRLAEVRWAMGRPRDALAALAEAKQHGADPFEVGRRQVWQSLYLPGPEGFEQSLALSAPLIATDQGRGDAMLHVWRAAGEGQRARWLLRNAGGADEFADARARALESIKTVVSLAKDPDKRARVVLRQMLDPAKYGGNPSDDDLAVFRGDPEIEAAILQP